jgi:hypothetical protein
MISPSLLLSASGRRVEEMESVLGSIIEMAIVFEKAYGVRITILDSTSDGPWADNSAVWSSFMPLYSQSPRELGIYLS